MRPSSRGAGTGPRLGCGQSPRCVLCGERVECSRIEWPCRTLSQQFAHESSQIGIRGAPLVSERLRVEAETGAPKLRVYVGIC